ncbi:MAG TPA: ATP-binding protein [Polyangiaceae bacterium]|nr:ATP-binding protein [Polyangiaceae bacterium]
MAILGRTERRLAFAIVLTAVVPLIVAVYFASSLVNQALGQAFTFTPEVSEHLDRGLGVYQDLAKALKDGMRHQADAIAAREPLRAAVVLRHPPSVQEELEAVFARYPNLVSLSIALPDGSILGSKDRGRPVEATERALEVRRPLGDGDSPELVAVFATPRARFDELKEASEFVTFFHQIESNKGNLKLADLKAFAAILVITIVVAVALASLLARSVTNRIGALALATQAVAAGDLTVRVPETGNDELTDLSRGFNRMLSEVEINRARVEFLQRMSTWQEMARRLAHEIKNPLTPILLAVEECHRKYDGADPKFRKLVDATLEIVEEEVGTLRRLVGEFSDFARLPRADLSESDLGDFLRDQKSHADLIREELARKADATLGAEAGPKERIAITWDIPDAPMPANLDRQMLHQVVSNVLRNAMQAVLSQKATGRIDVGVTLEHDSFVLWIDDDGPGVPEAMRESVFDPYVTTKADGTGLGLAIVKKIVVEHGGAVDAAPSPLGGARFRIRIPRASSAASRAAHETRGFADRASRITGSSH